MVHIVVLVAKKTGKRLAHVRERRTKKEFALFIIALAKTYSEAVVILCRHQKSLILTI
jgi:hypothetical protein